MKRCSNHESSEKCKSKSQDHYTPVRMAVVKKTTDRNGGEDVEKENPCTLLVRMYIGAAAVENSMEFPQKIKNGFSL